jgi:hypothetical protein
LAIPRPVIRGSRARWFALGAIVGAFAAGGATTAAVLQGPGLDRDLASFFSSPQMARAEVVMVVAGVVHDFRIDQGRVRGVRPNAIELYERDGTLQVVPVAPDARVQVNGAAARMRAIRRGMFAVVIRDGDGPAVIVRARLGAR